MKQQVGEYDEDRFRIVDDHAVPLDEGAAGNADADRSDQRHAHPSHPDIARRTDFLDRIDRHETHDDVRLAEISETPGHRTDEAEQGKPMGQAEKPFDRDVG